MASSLCVRWEIRVVVKKGKRKRRRHDRGPKDGYLLLDYVNTVDGRERHIEVELKYHPGLCHVPGEACHNKLPPWNSDSAIATSYMMAMT